MKKITFLYTLLIVSSFAFASSTLKLTGTIGTYQIEMSLESNKSSQDTILGKYNYKGKTAYLTLHAVLYEGNTLYIKESYNGKTTGEFYLEHEEGNWSGKWVAGSKSYEVNLVATGGDLTAFHSYKSRIPDKDINSAITGEYTSEYYFVNDIWFTKENSYIDIGYNGGTVLVDELGEDSIKVAFETVSGPTFHIAIFSGVASKEGTTKYIFNAPLYEGEESCHVEFDFKEGQLEIVQVSSNMDCGFGARAHAGGFFTKVSNSVSEDDFIQLIEK